MNMSYCRFQNTLRDLKDCIEHMEDEDLSEDEGSARQEMIDKCQHVAVMFGDLEGE
jgi:hypothetical protein